MTSFRSLHRRLLQPLLALSATAALSGILGVYWLASHALQEELQQRGQLLSATLAISAETSSSLADFHRAVLAIASQPSIDNILLLSSDYQPIFSGDSFNINTEIDEFQLLKPLLQQARDTGRSIGAVDSHNSNLYKVVSLIHIAALPQANVLTPVPSVLLVSLHTEQARVEALIGAAWVTALFISIGIIVFTAIYLLLNKLVLDPSQKIVAVMKAQSLKQDVSTGFSPEHELGLIGQTFDQLAQTLNAREQALKDVLIEAQEASIAKSQFLASMSHEIRTPMNGVIGMLHLLYQEPLNNKQQKYVQVAKSSADSLLSLINDILDVSKIEAGKLDIEIIDFDIHSLFNEVASTMSHRIENPRLKLMLEIQGIKQQLVQGDPSRLRQILTNLIGNAIKFTQQGTITIRAELNPINNNETKNLQLRCDIIDTGIGIANDKLKQLFDSFTQADSSTTREYGGSGLGLSIVKQLCEIMGGDVSVSSNLGEGSQFSFTLKLSHSDALLQANNHVEANITAPSLNTLTQYSSQHVLLVEDNTTNQLVALAMLENLGIQADVSENGLQAINKLRQTEGKYYSLIIMDCQMPIMDGFSATKNIRNGNAGDYYRDIPIIAMTANAMQGDRENCLNSGMNDYLPKPIDVTELFECLSKWLSTTEKVTNFIAPNLNNTSDVIIKSETKIWDRSVLEERLDHRESLIIKIIQSFLQNMPELISQFELQINNQEIAKLSLTIHSIKGVAANINATEFYILCTNIEKLIKNNLNKEIIDAWPEFNRGYHRLYQILENETG
jgi:signal transduction histidine kinase/CheY-like chemotaxis protein